MKLFLDTLSTWAVPLLVAGIPLYALTRKVNVYAAFLEGARGGFETGIRIVPPLVAVLVALGMLRASGALDAVARALAPLLDAARPAGQRAAAGGDPAALGRGGARGGGRRAPQPRGPTPTPGGWSR